MSDRERRQNLKNIQGSFGLSALLAITMLVGVTSAADIDRKVIAKTAPSYPEMARKMHLTGKVRLEIAIAPNGSVTRAKMVGGSPIFEKSALDAVKQWRFEPSDRETRGVIVLEFEDH